MVAQKVFLGVTQAVATREPWTRGSIIFAVVASNAAGFRINSVNVSEFCPRTCPLYVVRDQGTYNSGAGSGMAACPGTSAR